MPDTPEPPEGETPTPFKMSRRAHIITGIVFAAVFVCCLGAIQGWWWGPADPDEAPLSEQAENVCFDAVLDQLAAPSTAELVDINAAPAAGDHWLVTGSVDAENAFGAMLRAEFSCDLDKSGDRWRISSVDVA